MAGELRLVKYLYVDDDGNLIAETWSGVIAIGLPKSLLGKPGGVAMLDGNGHLPPAEMTPFLPQLDALPPAGPNYTGTPVRVKLPSDETPSGTKSEIFVCVMSSQDEYQWVKLAEST